MPLVRMTCLRGYGYLVACAETRVRPSVAGELGHVACAARKRLRARVRVLHPSPLRSKKRRGG